MRATVPLQAGTGGASKAPALCVRAIEKTSRSSALGQERQREQEQAQEPPAPLRVELVSRDDTSRYDPFWDAPRLLPTFVTQLLGQAMPERRESVSVETAYGRAGAPRTALLLDRKS
jgi:hypothetical protein